MYDVWTMVLLQVQTTSPTFQLLRMADKARERIAGSFRLQEMSLWLCDSEVEQGKNSEMPKLQRVSLLELWKHLQNREKLSGTCENM